MGSEKERHANGRDASGAHARDAAKDAAKAARAGGRLMSESQVEAMISLLTDSSDKVVDGCRRALRAHAELSEPLLRERLGQGLPDEESAAVRSALVDVVGHRLEQPLVDHIVNRPSLEEGSILIGRLIDASELPGAVTAALDALADQVGAELQRQTEPGRELAVLTDVLVRQNALTGSDPREADPWDAVLHGVTLRQRGLPLALCMTWILVARRVGIHLQGVNMPGHFLVRHESAGRSVVVDPYHRGRPVREQDCRKMLANAGYPSMDMGLLDASDRDMLLRSLRNLVMIASRRRERELAARCARILNKTSALTGP